IATSAVASSRSGAYRSPADSSSQMLVTSVTVRVALPASSLSEGVGMLRRRYLALVVFFAMLSTLFPLAREAAAVSTGVVISQVYGGGGNSGATLKNDFIELFNRGSAAIDVSAWSVQYASMLGTSWQRTNLSGSIAPGLRRHRQHPRRHHRDRAIAAEQRVAAWELLRPCAGGELNDTGGRRVWRGSGRQHLDHLQRTGERYRHLVPDRLRNEWRPRC